MFKKAGDIGKSEIQEDKANKMLTQANLKAVKSSTELRKLMTDKNIDFKKALKNIKYDDELIQLQIELVKLQQWINHNNKRVAIIFEGRDASGKGGTIRRFIEHLNPRSMRVVALDKPTNMQKGQWYFTRYVRELPNPGEIVFFDRSWYNRAVIEPVMGFCTSREYKQFMQQVPEFEHMLNEDGIDTIKLWFSITKKEQQKRFKSRKKNPLKQWKMSPVDQKVQKLWDDVTRYKEEMFSKTHTSYSPWIIIKSNNKKRARLESIRHVLANIDYEGRDESKTQVHPDPNVVMRFHRAINRID